MGTYDRPYPFDPCEPLRLEPDWIDEFLQWIAPVHPELAGLSPEAIRFIHAGLLRKDHHDSNRLSGADRVFKSDDGAIVVQGVKYTTARAVASRAVHLAAKRLGRKTRPPRDPLPLRDRRSALERYHERNPESRSSVLAWGSELTRGEVLFAVEHERACQLSDVLLRRTGVACAGHPGHDIVQAVAKLLRSRLDWSEVETERQIEAFDSDICFGREILRQLLRARS